MHDTIYELTTAELFSDASESVLQSAPPRLYCRGDVGLLKRTIRVSIIGSRNASPEGVKRSQRLAKILASESIVVVSGLAQGIDTAAHAAALNSHGKTIAVIGTAIDKYYPCENRSLQERIATDGLLVSQFNIGTMTTASNFVRRNLTMAMLSHATVVIEATETSGTIHQCREMIRLGRQVFFLRSLAESNVSWVRKMIRDGAKVLGNDNMGDLLGLFSGGGSVSCRK